MELDRKVAVSAQKGGFIDDGNGITGRVVGEGEMRMPTVI